MTRYGSPIRIIASLVLGVVLTIATTVACAFYEITTLQNDVLVQRYYGPCPGNAEHNWHLEGWSDFGLDSFMIEYWVYGPTESKLAERDYLTLNETPARLEFIERLVRPYVPPDDNAFMKIELRGVPFRSTYAVYELNADRHFGAIVVRKADYGPFSDDLVPVIPYWRGLLANVAIYSGFVWLLMMAFTEWRIRRRRKRNRCSSCGYSLRGLDAAARCPECSVESNA